MTTSIYTSPGDVIYKPELWSAESLQILFEHIGIRGMVHTDFSAEMAEKGDTINTRIPAIFTAQDTGSAGEVTSEQLPDATNVAVILDKNQEVTFPIRDVPQSHALKDLRIEFMEPAALALLRGIENNGISKMSDATNGFGDTTDSNVIAPTVTDANTPDTFALSIIARAAMELDVDKVPDDGRRHMVLSPKQLYDLVDASATQDLLLKANEVGGASALRNRAIGQLFGFNMSMQQGILQDAAAASGYPNAPVDKALFFHRNSVAYVTRGLPAIPPGLGAQVSTVSDSGQTLRVAIWYDGTAKAVKISIDALWGWKVMRQNMGGLIKTKATF